MVKKSKKTKAQVRKDPTAEFIAQCAKNVQARRASPKYQDAWRKEYCAGLRIGRQPEQESTIQSCAGVASSKSIFELEWKKTGDNEKELRERMALAEIKAKARCVAPAYNKGSLQFLGKKIIE